MIENAEINLKFVMENYENNNEKLYKVRDNNIIQLNDFQYRKVADRIC